MSQIIPVGIAGTGHYVPERVVTNDWFAGFLDTSDEWIRQRTGIRERRWAAEDERNSDMCVAAARQALEAAGTAPEELDLIVVATVSPDQVLPPCAPLVQKKLGAANAGAWDLSSACSGFVSALASIESMVAAGRARRILLIGSEVLSRYTDLTDRSSCVLFGDGAGAVVLAPHAECGRGEILRRTLGADGSGYDFIYMVAEGEKLRPSHETVERREHFIRLRGREVYKFAVQKMGEVIGEMLEGTDPDELGMIVPHQVNQRIIEAAIARYEIPPEKVYVNIDRYGNTSAASVPIALDECVRKGLLEPGKLVVLAAFGAGLTWAGALLRW